MGRVPGQGAAGRGDARYLARLTGHGLEGRVTEHLLQVHYGAGANGKSTFTETVVFTLGDYAAPADPDLLTARTFDAHPTGMADLFGLRLATLHESDQGRRLAEATVKRLTGGDRSRPGGCARTSGRSPPPHVRDPDQPPAPGHRHRRRHLAADPAGPVGRADPRRGEGRRARGPAPLGADAVLRFLAEGYAAWRDHGLADPEQVAKATAACAASPTPSAGSSTDRCLAGPYFSAQSADLFAAWSNGARGERGARHADRVLAGARPLGFDKGRTATGACQGRHCPGRRP